MSRVLRVRPARGQILPLFALMIFVICGFAALAIDVSSVYSERRSMRSAADAAALAGAQELQAPGSRKVRGSDRCDARELARRSLEERLGLTASAGGCASSFELKRGSTVVYSVKLTTPLSTADSCEKCDIDRSIAVDLRHPGFRLTFARALGVNAYDIGVTSIAEIGYARQYTIVTLRPAQDPSLDENRSITIDGGSELTVVNGDVASNGNLNYGGKGSRLDVDEALGFEFDFFGRGAPRWSGTPAGNRLARPIADPRYWEKLGSPTPTSTAVTYPGDATACTTALKDMTAHGDYGTIVGTRAATSITCLGAGRHSAAITVNNGDLAVLLPGVHFFEDSLTVKGTLIGGYTGGSPGVTLVFDEGLNRFSVLTPASKKTFDGAVVLNAGSRHVLSKTPGGSAATPARYTTAGGSIVLMQTDDVDDPKPLTLVVRPTGACAFDTMGRLLNESACKTAETKYYAINISGNAALYLGGVQYAPEDHVVVTGGGGSTGYVGQLWAWLLEYKGSSEIVQEGAESVGPGLLRLDAACTTADTNCGD